jgi:hypothetical protein
MPQIDANFGIGTLAGLTQLAVSNPAVTAGPRPSRILNDSRDHDWQFAARQSVPAEILFTAPV